MTGTNINLDLVNMNVYIKFGKVLLICSQSIERQFCYSVPNSRKMAGNNPNLDLVNIYVYIKFGKLLLICSNNIERKWNSDVNQG